MKLNNFIIKNKILVLNITERLNYILRQYNWYNKYNFITCTTNDTILLGFVNNVLLPIILVIFLSL